jgi:hypothetical protein
MTGPVYTWMKSPRQYKCDGQYNSNYTVITIHTGACFNFRNVGIQIEDRVVNRRSTHNGDMIYRLFSILVLSYLIVNLCKNI